jgi:hypothetical protein
MHCAAINVFGRPIHSHAQMAFAIVELLARANRSISFSLRELIYNKASLEKRSSPARPVLVVVLVSPSRPINILKYRARQCTP